jgi:hypothetical protein
MEGGDAALGGNEEVTTVYVYLRLSRMGMQAGISRHGLGSRT